jgi:hypothetical protein
MIRNAPPLLLVRATILRLRGRVRFVKDRIGAMEEGDDENFRVFRKVLLTPAKGQPARPGAIFTVQFRFARFGDRTNRLLSLIPIPFIVAQPGFRSKTWMSGQKSGAFRGVYEWDSIKDAEMYWVSFPMELMKKRAISESLRYDIREV